MQGTTETATTDAFGVVRAGVYGTKLSWVYEPLRGDAGLEQAQKQIFVQLQKPVKKPVKIDCETIHESWKDKLDKKFTACLIPTAVAVGCGAACLAPEPTLSKLACVLCIGLGAGLAGACTWKCQLDYSAERNNADAWKIRCQDKHSVSVR